MSPLVAGLLGAVAGAGGVLAAHHVRHLERSKDDAAKKVLDASRAGALPAPELKKAAVAFGVEAVKSKRKGKLARSRAYEQAMMEVASQGAAIGSAFGGGFHLGDVVRDVNAVVNNVGDALSSYPTAAPMYPPAYAPELYASGPYDYHRGTVGDHWPYPDAYRHHDRHF